MRWAVVTGTSPLRVQLDGDSTALPYAPKCLAGVEALTAGDMVVTDRIDGTVVILGRPGGGVPFASVAETQAFASSTKAVTPAGLAGVLRPVIGQIPSSVSVGSGSASVAADGTVTFAGVSRVSLDGVFDGLGMDVYKIIAVFTSSAGAFVSTNLRAAGTDLGTGYNFTSTVTQLSAGPTRSSGTSRTTFGYWVPTAAGAASVSGSMRIANPMSTTLVKLIRLESESAAAGDRYKYDEFGDLGGATAADGFSIIAASGTITGMLKVVKA